MVDTTYINFYHTLEEAITERTSHQTLMYEVRGIQLLPNNQYPYIQATQTDNGIELEDWTVFVVDACTGDEQDVTNYFVVERTFVDSNSNAQLDWSLTNVPYDFGYHLVYLKVTQLNTTDVFYSNLFQLTSKESNKTVRVDYKGVDQVLMKSIQLQMWFWQYIKVQEVSTYYETSTRLTRTNTIKSQKAEKWITPMISNSLWLKITEMMESKDIYFDFYRCNLFENLELKEHEGQRNSEQNILKLSFDKSDVYDPFFVDTTQEVDNTIYFNYDLNSYL